jgi:adenine-specific DNA-methyltransferase
MTRATRKIAVLTVRSTPDLNLTGPTSEPRPKRLTRLHLIRCIRSLRSIRTPRSADPARIVGSVLRLWCQRQYPDLTGTRLPWSKELANAAPVCAFVEMLGQLPFLEAAYWLSTAYADLCSEEYRTRMAMYFTPPPIANRLLADLEANGADFASHSFLDPACGGAAFLTVVASRMRQQLIDHGATSAGILRAAQKQLVGMDRDPTLCALSRQFLRMVFGSEIRRARIKPKFQITCGDSLNALNSKSFHFDVVVCNPPFRKLNADDAEAYRPNYADVMQAQPNLYALFIGLAVRLAKPDGLVGLVTPTSFLSGQYFSSVRTFLLTKVQIAHVGLVPQKANVYLSVEQETALTVLHTSPPILRQIQRPGISIIKGDGQYSKIGHCPLPNSGHSWPLARSREDIALLRSVSKSSFRLADYGYTPTVGYFVWNRDKRPAYMTLDQVPKHRRQHVVPLLWSSDVRQSGSLLFDPRKSAHGQHRYVDFDGSTHPAVKHQSGVLLQRVTSSEQPRRLIGAVLSEAFVKAHGGYVGENHVVVLERRDPSIGISPRQLLRLLATNAVDRYFRCISGSSNVSVFELDQLPLPDPAKLKNLMARGTSIESAADQILFAAIAEAGPAWRKH